MLQFRRLESRPPLIDLNPTSNLNPIEIPSSKLSPPLLLLSLDTTAEKCVGVVKLWVLLSLLLWWPSRYCFGCFVVSSLFICTTLRLVYLISSLKYKHKWPHKCKFSLGSVRNYLHVEFFYQLYLGPILFKLRVWYSKVHLSNLVCNFWTYLFLQYCSHQCWMGSNDYQSLMTLSLLPLNHGDINWIQLEIWEIGNAVNRTRGSWDQKPVC